MDCDNSGLFTEKELEEQIKDPSKHTAHSKIATMFWNKYKYYKVL